MQIQLTVDLPEQYATQLKNVPNSVISHAVQEALDREAQTLFEEDDQEFDTIIDEVVQSSEMHRKFEKLNIIFADKNI